MFPNIRSSYKYNQSNSCHESMHKLKSNLKPDSLLSVSPPKKKYMLASK